MGLGIYLVNKTNTEEWIKNFRQKEKWNRKCDALIQIQLLMCIIYDGTKCKICGVIQGEPKKGFEKYYCEHLTKNLDRRFLKERKMIANKMMGIAVKEIEEHSHKKV